MPASRLDIRDIKEWGGISLGTYEGRYFSNVENFTITAKDSPDLSETIVMFGAFENATNFNSPLGHWDVSDVKDMGVMFKNAKAFNQDLSTWNVSNVTSMSAMFASAKAFNRDLSTWDVSSVEYMTLMFWNTEAFNQDLSTWDVSKVIGCSLFSLYADSMWTSSSPSKLPNFSKCSP